MGSRGSILGLRCGHSPAGRGDQPGSPQKPTLGAALLAIALAMRFALVYLPRVVRNIDDPGPWTSGFEILAMCGIALVLLGRANPFPRAPGSSATVWLGRFLFASLLLVVGTQRRYAGFVATLVPAWMPWRLFWAYLVGTAFFAAALAIITGKLARMATTLLGTMFLLFVITLHVPRIAGRFHNGNEWTKRVCRPGMSGGAFALAGVLAGADHSEFPAQAVSAARTG